MIDFTTIVALATGLVVFLYGIEHFGREILSIAGGGFQYWLERFASNRFYGTALGAGVTALIQSSTATTVIAVSLVSGGFISFAQSLPIIFGANIGTTITAQLVAFKVTNIAPFFLVIGFIVGTFGRHYRTIGKGIFYFGLVFFGLALVGEAVEPVKDNRAVMELLASFDNILIAFLAGLVVTAIVQSSSVTTGLVVVLAANGMISLEQGIPILLGTNIGTTVTAQLAAMRLSLHARRGAMAHTLFNVIGALLFLPFVNPFAAWVGELGGSTAQQVANAHTVFNVAVTVVFLVFLDPLRRLVERLVTGEEHEIILKPVYIGKSLPEDTAEAFELIAQEMSYLREMVARLYRRVFEFQMQRTSPLSAEVEKLEALSDVLDETIERALVEVSARRLNEAQAVQVLTLIRLSNSIEQLADIATDQANLIRTENAPDPERLSVEYRDLLPVHEDLVALIERYAHSESVSDEFDALQVELDNFKFEIARSYETHVEQLRRETTYNSAFFVDMVSLIEAVVGKFREVLELSMAVEKPDTEYARGLSTAGDD